MVYTPMANPYSQSTSASLTMVPTGPPSSPEARSNGATTSGTTNTPGSSGAFSHPPRGRGSTPSFSRARLNNSKSMNPSDNRPLGRTASTHRGRQDALVLFNRYRRLELDWDEFHESNKEEYAGEMLEHFIYRAGVFLSSTAIPVRSNDQFQPLSENHTQYLTCSTLTQYLGRYMQECRDRDPDHPDWPASPREMPVWYKEFLPQFVAECELFHETLKHNPNIVFGRSECRPLYPSNQPYQSPTDKEMLEEWHNIGGTGNAVLSQDDQFLGFFDQQAVNMYYLRNCDPLKPFSYRAFHVLVTMYHCACRGGEPKFLNSNEFEWHGNMQGISYMCNERKRIRCNNLLMVTSRHGYALDIFYSQAVFFGPGRGLVRTPEQMKSGLGSVLFDFLYTMSDKHVSHHITGLIRAAIPPHVPKRVRDSFSSTSYRKAAITELSIHPECGIFETCARSGHTTNTNVDKYLDPKNVARSKVGASVLAGNETSKRVVRCARLECLGVVVRPQVERLLKLIFTINVSYNVSHCFVVLYFIF